MGAGQSQRLADEADQFVGVAKLARLGHAGGQIAAQRDDMADAVGAIGFQNFANALARRSHAGQVRRGGESGGLDIEHRFQRAIAC